jgi:outer membrane lipoprotein SlyB
VSLLCDALFDTGEQIMTKNIVLRHLVAAAVVGPALLISGCASPGGTSDSAVHRCMECGVIQSITPRETESGRPNAAGAMTGAIVGGIVGHQFGSGRGQDAATAAGVIGGAVAGSQYGRGRLELVYDLLIRMDRGGVRRMTVSNVTGLAVGDRVEILPGRVAPSRN